MPIALRSILALSASCLALPAPALAADPAPAKPSVELVYEDALNCAVYDGFSANMLDGSTGDLAEQQAYYNKAGDLWLDILVKVGPNTEDQVMSDFQKHVDLLVKGFKADYDTVGQDAALTKMIDKYGDQCAQLEQVTFATVKAATEAAP